MWKIVSINAHWWNEIKQLCGSSKNTGCDLQASLHPDLKFEGQELYEQINEAFTTAMERYSIIQKY